MTTSVSSRSISSVVLLEQAEGLVAVRRSEHLVAAACQHLADEPADRLFVLGEQYPLCAGPLRRPLLALNQGGRVVGRLRQDDAECRPLAELRGDGDLAARLRDDPVDGGEAEPRTLPRILRGVERLESVTDRLRAHPGSAVADDQLDLAVEALHGDRPPCPRGHRVAGVERRDS